MIYVVEARYVVKCGNDYLPRCKTFPCCKWNAKKQKYDIYPVETVVLRACEWLNKRKIAGLVYRVGWSTDKVGVFFTFVKEVFFR